MQKTTILTPERDHPMRRPEPSHARNERHMLIITHNSLPKKTIFAHPFYYYKLYPSSKEYILSFT
jgi:hypothetical protein